MTCARTSGARLLPSGSAAGAAGSRVSRPRTRLRRAHNPRGRLVHGNCVELAGSEVFNAARCPPPSNDRLHAWSAAA